MTRGERARWAIADALNRLPGQCWADLATWAMNWPERGLSPWSPQRSCRDDANQAGSCYCGKLQADPWATAVLDAHHPDIRADIYADDWTPRCTCGWTGHRFRDHLDEQIDAARPAVQP